MKLLDVLHKKLDLIRDLDSGKGAIIERFLIKRLHDREVALK